MKNSNDTIVNRTSDLPDCGTVPQPTCKKENLYLFHSFHKFVSQNTLRKFMKFDLEFTWIGDYIMPVRTTIKFRWQLLVLTPKYQMRNWSSIQIEMTDGWRLNDITLSIVGTRNLLISHTAEDKNTGWTQKHCLISSSYKIKTDWNIFKNMGRQIH